MSWAEISIGDLGKVVTGDTPPRKNPEYYGSAYPFIKPTDMKVGQRLTTTYEEGYSEDGFEKYCKKLVPMGSTAVVTIGSIGQKLTWLHADSFVNQAVNAVIPNRDKFDSLYVYYFLNPWSQGQKQVLFYLKSTGYKIATSRFWVKARKIVTY